MAESAESVESAKSAKSQKFSSATYISDVVFVFLPSVFLVHLYEISTRNLLPVLSPPHGNSFAARYRTAAPLTPGGKTTARLREALNLMLGKVAEKKIRKKCGLLPNQGGGSPMVNKKPNLKFAEY